MSDIIDFGKAKQKIKDNKDLTAEEIENKILERAKLEYEDGVDTPFSNYRQELSREVVTFISEKLEEREKIFKDYGQSFDIIDVLNRSIDVVNEYVAQIAVDAYKSGDLTAEDIPLSMLIHFPEDLAEEIISKKNPSISDVFEELIDFKEDE